MGRSETERQRAGGGRRGSRAGRLARRVLGLVGLFAVMLLVVGVGLVVRSPEPPERVHSVSERAQLDAELRYRSAADQARIAAAAPALDPEAAAELAAAAADLDEQAGAVALPRSPGPTAEPGPGPAGDPATGATAGSSAPSSAGPAAPTPADGPAVLAALRDSALQSLRDAAGADPGPARVLAAAGVNQWRHALRLGDTLGVDPGLPSPGALSAVDLAAGTGPFADLPVPDASTGVDPTVPPTGSATPAAPEECAGTPLGPDADRLALLHARTAEDEARYAYEVAAALLPEPAEALARASVHREAAEAVADRLAALCVPESPTASGYAIGPDFRADPVAATRAIEQEHAELYAGLIATVGREARAWAVVSFSAAAQRSLDAGTPLDALPGLAIPTATPAPASPTALPTALPTEESGG